MRLTNNSRRNGRLILALLLLTGVAFAQFPGGRGRNRNDRDQRDDRNRSANSDSQDNSESLKGVKTTPT